MKGALWQCAKPSIKPDRTYALVLSSYMQRTAHSASCPVAQHPRCCHYIYIQEPQRLSLGYEFSSVCKSMLHTHKHMLCWAHMIQTQENTNSINVLSQLQWFQVNTQWIILPTLLFTVEKLVYWSNEPLALWTRPLLEMLKVDSFKMFAENGSLALLTWGNALTHSQCSPLGWGLHENDQWCKHKQNGWPWRVQSQYSSTNKCGV